MVRTQVLKHLPGARKGKRSGSKEDVRKGATEKGGCVRSLRGRRSEEMTQSNTSSPWRSKYLWNPEGMMAIEVPQNEEISGGGKNGGRKGVGSAIGEEQIGERTH